MIIFIDQGNTNTKIKYNDQTLIFPTKNFSDPASFKEFASKNISISKNDKLYLSSVVPKFSKIIIDYFHKHNVSVYEVNTNSNLSVSIDNVHGGIGSDLLAIAEYANSVGNDVAIVNFGTATTITHVKNKILEGVIIIPGFEISLKALISGADKLKEIELKASDAPLGRNTIEAISIGMINGTCEMVKGLIKKINPKQVYISGGNALYLKEQLPDYLFEEEITLKGIELIWKLNQQ